MESNERILFLPEMVTKTFRNTAWINCGGCDYLSEKET